jgi:hypothetical protein
MARLPFGRRLIGGEPHGANVQRRVARIFARRLEDFLAVDGTLISRIMAARPRRQLPTGTVTFLFRS